MTKECTKCSGEFTWKQPYDGTKTPVGDKPCTCTPKVAKASGPVELSKDNIEEFAILWNKVYQRCSGLAAQVSDERTDALGKHITTCGIVHDYFSYLK